jgi:predicted acetyltransferase
MSADIRTLEPAQVPAAWAVLERSFGHDLHREDTEVELGLVDPSRFYAGFVDGDLVATAGSFALEMAVPGRVVPVAGVTWVGVLPTARRRGLLTALMERQLGDLHSAGASVAALWASEGAIYGRYGYGPAAWNVAISLRRGAAFRRDVPAGSLRLVAPDAAALADVYGQVAAATPGFPARDEAWWAYRLHDPQHARKGAAPLQCVVTDGGYALYAVDAQWEDTLPAGVVHVRELLAVDEGARGRLWRYLLDLDLAAEVRASSLAPDDPLVLSWLAEPRAARPRVRDSLWVRVLDVPAALAGRRYACDVDVVVEVSDEHAPQNAGRWHLTGGRTAASCERTQAPPDLALAVSDLGAAYLGGTPLRARPVEQRTPGALDVASTAFGPVGAAPWCPLVF